MVVKPDTCSLFLTMLSALFNTSVVLEREAPGGIAIEKVMKLSSSVGIKLEGVLFIIHTPIAHNRVKARIVIRFRSNKRLRELTYLLVNVSKALLKRLKKLPFARLSLVSLTIALGSLFLRFLFFNRRAHKTGLNVNAFKADIKIAVAS